MATGAGLVRLTVTVRSVPPAPAMSAGPVAPPSLDDAANTPEALWRTCARTDGRGRLPMRAWLHWAPGTPVQLNKVGTGLVATVLEATAAGPDAAPDVVGQRLSRVDARGRLQLPAGWGSQAVSIARTPTGVVLSEAGDLR